MAIVIEEAHDLEVLSITGFDGNPIGGLKLHPDGIHIVYPLGCKVVVQNWKTKRQEFYTGHTNIISAVAISPDGKMVASGQINHMGFKAIVILWDFASRQQLAQHEVHKVRVQAVEFSCDSSYLISLGGRDDSNVVVWDVKAEEALCGTQASEGTAGDAVVLRHTNNRDPCFLSAGEGTLRVWRIDPSARKVRPTTVKLGMLKRHILCIVIDERDEHAYCGTTTGDIVKARLNYDFDTSILDPVMTPVLIGCYGKISPKKRGGSDPTERYSQGVTGIALLEEESGTTIIIAAGDGTVELVKEKEVHHKDPNSKLKQPCEPRLQAIKSVRVPDGITSLQKMGKSLLIGTVKCEILTVDLQTFKVILHITCHTDAVYDVAFPYHFSDVYATCSKHDIRIWNTTTSKELLRISVPNYTCSSVTFSFDGTSIVSGWNDGLIRAFTPQTGKLMYSILNAHSKGVSALAITTCGSKIISGGGEGEVRVWEVRPTFQRLIGILKEHKGPVSSVAICPSDTEAVSASTDGTCIIWDIVRLVRNQIMFANTQFMCVRYHPTGVQLLTTGTDRKIGYWEVFDGSQIRDLEASTAAGVNTIDISPNGNYIVTGGCDMYVKVWKYKDGITTHVGIGHAAVITCVRFSPDSRFIISVSGDGGIFRWKNPYEGVVEDDDISVISDVPSTRSTCSIRERMWDKTKQRLPATPESKGGGDAPPLSRESVASKSSTKSETSSVKSKVLSHSSKRQESVHSLTRSTGDKHSRRGSKEVSVKSVRSSSETPVIEE